MSGNHTCNDVLFIWGQSQVALWVGAREGVTLRQRALKLARIPNLHGAVRAARVQSHVITGELHTSDISLVLMSSTDHQLGPAGGAGGTPQLQRAVKPSTHDKLAVTRVTARRDRCPSATPALELDDLSVLFNHISVPHSQGTVLATRQEGVSVERVPHASAGSVHVTLGVLQIVQVHVPTAEVVCFPALSVEDFRTGRAGDEQQGVAAVVVADVSDLMAFIGLFEAVRSHALVHGRELIDVELVVIGPGDGAVATLVPSQRRHGPVVAPHGGHV